MVIAIALACGPDLLIADEPTTALDTTVQREVLDLLDELRRASGMALLLISHDLDVMAAHVERLAVMYGGVIVESGPTRAVFERRAHPYTRGLFAARPRLGTDRTRAVGDHRRPRACAARDAVGLRLRRSLHAGRRRLPIGRAAGGHSRRRPLRALHSLGRVAMSVHPGAHSAEGGSVRAASLVEAIGLGQRYRLPRERLLAPGAVVQALDDVSFTLRAGTTLGIVGESGSGKSTLARLVMALEAPSAGRLLLRGP